MADSALLKADHALLKADHVLSVTPRVQILDDIVIDQIAAGEVVERPASVVKELVENSIDAAATEIVVVIDNGGRSSIEVIDDGCGMDREDALLSVERFGTSKIRDASDLEEIKTLGFRGEALSSIAAVSQFSISTCQNVGGGDGVEIRIAGGEFLGTNEISCSRGTRVSVRQLFYNVPARRNFLRSEATETALIKSLLVDFAAAYPEIGFRLVTDGKESLTFAPKQEYFARLKDLELAGKSPLTINGEELTSSGKLSVAGIVSQPISSVASSSRLRLIVNGRSVRDRLLLKAVRDAYGNFLRPGKYPAGIVRLTIPASEVDVNVHPQKSEVRFRNPDVVFRVMRSQVARKLRDATPMVQEPVAFEQLSTQSAAVRSERLGPLENLGRSEKLGGFEPPSQLSAFRPKFGPEIEFIAGDGKREPTISSPHGRKLSLMRYVGEIFHCYLLLEGFEEFAVVDMHAAHERVTFHRLRTELQAGALKSQVLLVPEIVELPVEFGLNFSDFEPVLRELGIECECYSDNCLVVRSLPAALGTVSAKEIIEDLSQMFERMGWQSVMGSRLDAVVARIACHGSIRSGRDLERDEVYALLSQLEETEGSQYCPHGRPVVKYYSRRDIEVMFGRM